MECFSNITVTYLFVLNVNSFFHGAVCSLISFKSRA